MENDMIPLSREDRFQFACGPEVPCFNACCRDLNQFLTPYDILRLKTALKLASGAFLARYTVGHVGPQSGLPVVRLKAAADNDLRCPFVSEKGCRVYADRPASCRTYPLARAITRSRETGVVSEHFALMREDHCCGCHEIRTQTVNEWLEDQVVAPYNWYNDMLMDIISMKNRHHPRPLDIREQRLFHMALYDLDGFRRHLGESAGHEASGSVRVDTMSDEELLVFGYAWLKRALFGKDQPA